MASYVIRGIPDGLITRAKARARADDTRLEAVLIEYLEGYAEGGSAAAQLGAQGGAARAARMTSAQRIASAKHAAAARWKQASSD